MIDKKTFLKTLINMINKDEFKKEIKNILSPIIKIIWLEIYPYIYFSFFLILVTFILSLAIFFRLMNKKKIV